MALKPSNNLSTQLELAIDANIFAPNLKDCPPPGDFAKVSPSVSGNPEKVGVAPTAKTEAKPANVLATPPRNHSDDLLFDLNSDGSLDDILSLSQSPIQISRAPLNKRKAPPKEDPKEEGPLKDVSNLHAPQDASHQGSLHSLTPDLCEITPGPKVEPASSSQRGRRAPTDFIDLSQPPPAPPLSSPPQRPVQIIDSSPVAPRPMQAPDLGRFRLSQAPASHSADLPKPEIGALFTEKIALLEQLVSKLKYELIKNGVKWSADDLNAKLRDVDHRIDNFAETQLEDEDEVVELFSSPRSQKDAYPAFNDSLYQNYEEDSYLDFADAADDFVNGPDPRAGHADDSDFEEVGFSTHGRSLPSGPVSSDRAGSSSVARQIDEVYADSDSDELSSMPLGPAPTSRSPYFDAEADKALRALDRAEPPPQPVAASQHQPQHRWTRDVMHALKTKFGLQAFRANQAEAINETLAGKDVAVLMPTGGGKSLCYQLPALVTSGATRGTTIVISPLISLMQDQVYHLKNRNIRAEALSSRLGGAERTQVLSQLMNGELQLLYASPEMLSASGAMRAAMQKLSGGGQLARIVIDEAHCVSSWGHDFRPDYLELTKVRHSFPNTPIMALTATANERVLLDIVGCLRANPLVLKQSFNRRNLFYEVLPKVGNVSNEIIRICHQSRGKTGIVYCNSKRDCEDLASKLVRAGIPADFYHAGMEQDRRSSVQAAWQQGKCQVVCATIAFGMGIDKPDVRFVIHMTIPRNMEGFYQETGRAGRDGKPSRCILFYSYRDVSMLQKMIQTDSNLNYQHKEHHRVLLNRVMQYCENKTDCRRKQILQYFNETFNPAHCHLQCDNCRAMRDQTVVSHNMTGEAQLVVATMQGLSPQLITTQQCIDVMLGRRTQKTRSCKFDELANFGKLSSLGATSVERLVHTLISEQVLQEYAQFNHSRYPQTYLKLGGQAGKVMRNEMPIVLKMASADAGSGGTKKRAASRAAFSSASRGAAKRRSA